jgi:putative glycosyltransferase (TIGR04372 family)
MFRIIKKIISLLLNPFFGKNKYFYTQPSYLGSLLDLLYLSLENKKIIVIIDPLQILQKTKIVNNKIFTLAYSYIMKRKLNAFLNFLYYLYYRANLFTKNLDHITANGFKHGDAAVFEKLLKKKNIFFDINYSKSENSEINQVIQNKYLLFHCRDNAYKQKTTKHNNSYHNYRNESLSNYEKALSNFINKDLNLVRFGSIAEKRCSNKKIFDYTFSKNRNQGNDLLLMKNCEIYIGTGSGPDVLAINFQKPIVFVNWIHPLNLFTFKEDVVVIFKKIFDKNNKKFISYKNLIDSNFKLKNEKLPVGLFTTSEQYKKFDLEVIENTPEEIYSAVNEMLNFRKGKFSFDTDLQNKFKIPYTEKTKNNFAPNFYISEYFIKKNQDLFN